MSEYPATSWPLENQPATDRPEWGWSDSVERLKNGRETTEARLLLLEAHIENLLERVAGLEEIMDGSEDDELDIPLDATGLLAELRLRELERRGR